ncbi:MAG: bifunctional 4-hydroxy-2-oxoglutarate aldolase/2-dehydro-3-deoxy-phosphogluconate aldolase [Bdellovibrionales bacterium]|nr:bifunctional 4-hydroxy-2-oxoglutarate aldolase/2-dehydro-3-deoxy-phosphogluconate aldolase [Bdellovibrionales bacterium]
MFSWTTFDAMPIVAILRGFAFDETRALVAACREAGILNFEVTMNTVGAPSQIEALAKDHADCNIGAGTVCTLDELSAATGAGATFIITPGLFPEVVARAKQQAMAVFPGAFTPTEVYQAWELGADIVKLFPASVLGADYLKDLRGPFPQIKLMPTGGVSSENLEAYRRAGACAFGVGGTMFERSLVAEGRWNEVTARARALCAAYERASTSA